MPITIRKLLKSTRRVTGRSRNEIIIAPPIISDRRSKQDSTLTARCLIYLKNGGPISRTLSPPVGYRMADAGGACIMIKRALLAVAIVAMSGFLFEASAADPVIAVKVAK